MDKKFFDQYEQYDKYYRAVLTQDMAYNIREHVGDIEFLLKINRMIEEQIEKEADPDYVYQGVGETTLRSK